jgi:LysM repeat protein
MKKRALLALAAVIFTSCTPMVRKVSIVDVENDEAKMRKEAQVETSAGPEEFTVYVVKAGDTLSSIAVGACKKYSAWKKIAEKNGIKEPYILRTGEKLKIGGGCAGAVPSSVQDAKKPFVCRIVANKAFGVGEKLVFSVKYFGVTAGIATLEVKDLADFNGRKAYHIEATARTAPFFETFYRVKDVISSYMDVLGLFSWKYSKHLEEGGYRNDTTIIFDQEKGFAEKNNDQKCDIPAFVQDVLSEFYYFRSVFRGENETKIDVASDECKTYQIVVKKIREEKITTDAGEFNCVVVQPFLKYEGIFRQKGNVWIWLTNDANLTPVLIKSEIAIGTIDVVLQEATVVKAE